MALAALVPWTTFGSGASAQAPAPAVTVVVFADRYVAGGRTIDDLDVLAAAVVEARPRAVRLHACGDGTARAQQAAAYRFRDLYLELRLLDADSPDCLAATGPRRMSVAVRSGERPTGIDDAAVDAWWNASMP